MGILNIILLATGILFLLVGAFFLFQALTMRSSVGDLAYGVQKQEATLSTRINIARAVLFFILGLIVLSVFALIPSSNEEESVPTETPTAEQSPQPSTTSQPTRTATLVQETATASATVPSRTPFPTDTPEPTETPALPSAVVNSPNGLWLREAPGGSQELELVPDGTVLILLAGRETADELEWQEVRTPAGNEGWVAVEFIEYQ